MKRIVFCLLVFAQKFSFAQQNVDKLPIINLPKIKSTTLTLVDNQFKFNTAKWQKIDTTHWLNYFAVENKKMWTGQQVTDIRVLGSWGLGEAAVAYLYAIDILQDDNTTIPSIFISSYNATTMQKGIDVDPFNQVPAPTGMKGKVVVTKTISINEFGGCTATSTHKGANKILSKKVQFSINEDGSVSKL